MNKAWLVSLLITAVALSGCTGDDDSDAVVDDFREEFQTQSTEQDTTNDGTGNEGGSQSSGNEGGEETSDSQEEAAPGSISVSLEADNLTGVAPLSVSFSIDATATDANGDAAVAEFTWALFSQDESQGYEESGEGLPATASFTFDTPGNYTLIAGVSADGFEEGFANVTIVVTDAAPAPPAAPSQDFEGSWIGGPYGCALRRTGYQEDDPNNGISYVAFLIDPATIGAPYDVTISGSVGLVTFEISDDSGTALVGEYNIGDGGDISLQGTVPNNANFVFVTGCPVGGSITYHAG